MKSKSLMASILILALYSCTYNSNVPDKITNNSQQINPLPYEEVPFSTEDELYSAYENNPENVIHYKVARLLAITELLNGADISLQGRIDPSVKWTLTKQPKIVYNYDHTPRYYEFGYISDGKWTGTVTTFAQKEENGAIAYVFDSPLKCDCPDHEFYVGNYPQRYYGNDGVCYLKDCTEELINPTELPLTNNSREDRDFMLSQMTEEDIKGMEMDLEGTDEINELIALQEETKKFWNEIDDYIQNEKPEIIEYDKNPYTIEPISLNDIINQRYSDNSDIKTAITISNDIIDYDDSYNKFVLNNYDNPYLQMTRWTGFCGPAACAWLYRGIYEYFQGKYLPLIGDGADTEHYFYENTYTNPPHAVYEMSDIDNSWNRSLDEVLDDYCERSIQMDNGLTACFYKETIPFKALGKCQYLCITEV